MDVEIPDEVPDRLKDLMEEGIFTSTIDPVEVPIYINARQGCCMCCGARLGESTTLVVSQHGVVLMYCGGPCMTDHGTVGFLQEQLEDIMQKVRFRGGEDADG